MPASPWATTTPKPPPRAPTRPKIPPDQARGPQRTCIGCRTAKTQDQLVRVARTAEGSLVASRTLPGRGAWLCRGSSACLDLAARRGGFARSFRAPVGTHAIDELRSMMAADQGT